MVVGVTFGLKVALEVDAFEILLFFGEKANLGLTLTR